MRCCLRTSMCGCWTRGWLPGQMVPLQTHRWASVLYIVSWSDFVRRDGDGVVVADSRGFAEGLLGRAGGLVGGAVAAHAGKCGGDGTAGDCGGTEAVLRRVPWAGRV